jgi:hypothetical protein
MMTRNILSRRSHPRSESFGVRQNLVVDLIPFQTVQKSRRYVHNFLSDLIFGNLILGLNFGFRWPSEVTTSINRPI